MRWDLGHLIRTDLTLLPDVIRVCRGGGGGGGGAVVLNSLEYFRVSLSP